MIKLNFGFPRLPADRFPQINRVFSATILWLGLIGLLGINLLNMSKASLPDVLGVFSDYQKELSRIQAEKESVQKQYRFWQGVVKEKPDYRDAYITLTSLSYQLGFMDEARTYLSQATGLDPSNQSVQQLMKILP